MEKREKINRQEFEKAIIFVVDKFKNIKEADKPTLFHSIHTGLMLYDAGYDRNIVLGGLMHDLIEDTQTSEDEINELFGVDVANIVVANTKDTTIQDKKERRKKMIENCIKTGEEASIVKAADIVENYTYHPKIGWTEGVEYLNDCSDLLLTLKPDNFNDPIFDQLAKVRNE